MGQLDELAHDLWLREGYELVCLRRHLRPQEAHPLHLFCPAAGLVFAWVVVAQRQPEHYLLTWADARSFVVSTFSCSALQSWLWSQTWISFWHSKRASVLVQLILMQTSESPYPLSEEWSRQRLLRKPAPEPAQLEVDSFVSQVPLLPVVSLVTGQRPAPFVQQGSEVVSAALVRNKERRQ